MNIPFNTGSVLHLMIGFVGFYILSVGLNAFGLDQDLADKISLGVLVALSLFKELNDRGRWIKAILTSRSKSNFDFWDLVYSVVPTLIFLAIRYQ